MDPNRSLVTVNGNKMYKILKGASALHPKLFTDYDLTFKLRTPAVMPDLGTLYVYDRSVASNSGKIAYKKLADGTSQWILYGPTWTVLQTKNLPTQDLQPDTDYTLRILVDGASIRVYVNGELRLDGSDPKHNASGTVGFYVGGFSEMWFDDVKFMRIDKTAPVSTAVLTPALPDGADGWYTQPVTVQLNTADTGTSVTDTVYSINGGDTWLPYQGPLTFSQDGQYSLLYRSVDYAGNSGESKTLSFKLDSSAPELTVAEAGPESLCGDRIADLVLGGHRWDVRGGFRQDRCTAG